MPILRISVNKFWREIKEMWNTHREEVIADFKQWLDEHKEQVQAHTLDALPMEDFDDDWEDKSDGEVY